MKYKNNTIRINFSFIMCIVLLFCLFFVKLGYVALSEEVEGTNLKELADSRTTVTKTLTASRGAIYDKHGEELAINANAYTVIAYLSDSRTSDERYPKHVVDKETTAASLSEILLPLNPKMTKEYILSLLNQNSYQVELGPGGRGVSEIVKQKIEALTLPGIDFIKTNKRYYPNADFASYIIGYAKKNDATEELTGELGIEGYCDRYLKGKDGSLTYQKDAYGYQMADKTSYTKAAEDGLDVYLTLDANVQLYLENAVAEFEKGEPEWVTLTVADAKTGAIVGSATSPSFDPNKLNIKQYNNPLISFNYEPGSTMKIFSFMSAIEENKYKGDELYQSGTIEVDDYTIKDWNKTGWGKISYDTGFTYSSNVAAVRLAQQLGKKTLSNYYHDLGFGSKTGIELANEYAGEIDIEYGTELASASYGQGITVTPIQMLQALSVLTNDGTVLKPYIIDKIVDTNKDEIIYQGKKTPLKHVYSTSTINKITELMDATVNGDDKVATGRVYHTDAVRLIGKTGTANYIGTDGKYLTGTYNVIKSFAGVFPKEEPEYIIYVAVKDYKGTSKNMGDILKDVVESVAKYRNIDERASDKDESKIITVDSYINKSVISSVSKLEKVFAKPIVIGDGDIVINHYPKKNTKVIQNSKIFLLTNGTKIKMPDVRGWSSSEFINFCNIIGIKYELNGYGYVESTNIKTDDIIDLAGTITANLKNVDPESLIDKPEEE